MRISIITASFNRVDTIRGAIETLQKQSYFDWEHVIQDCCSTDGTLEELARWSDDRRVVVSEADSGIYDALNRGVFRSSGDVIGILHSDDWFTDRDILEKVASMFESDEVDGVYGDLEYVSSSDPSRVVRHWRSGCYSANQLKLGWMPPHPTLFLRRRVFDSWGGYDSSFRISGDYEAILRWLLRGNIRLEYIPEVFVKMRIGGESNRSLERILTKTREDYRAARLHNVGGLGTVLLKNLRKINQFVLRAPPRSE